MTARKADPHAKPGRRPRAPKEEATFDTELQRYVMPGECSVTEQRKQMNEHCAFCGGNDWTEIDSKKVHCLKCGANRFLSQALPKKPKKAKTEGKSTSAVSHIDTDSDSNGEQ